MAFFQLISNVFNYQILEFNELTMGKRLQLIVYMTLLFTVHPGAAQN